MIICVANSKDQTKKLKHKGSTGKKKESETESETITENEMHKANIKIQSSRIIDKTQNKHKFLKGQIFPSN